MKMNENNIKSPFVRILETVSLEKKQNSYQIKTAVDRIKKIFTKRSIDA